MTSSSTTAFADVVGVFEVRWAGGSAVVELPVFDPWRSRALLEWVRDCATCDEDLDDAVEVARRLRIRQIG